ncbi:MAG TPA: thermonuclease family protein [Myxococcota bacterium]|nr:thermonuclease family protein [Myxococcota bacterium]HQK51098.1 thermonuclease family protein [Myxococcota bacterium]
MPPGVRIGRAIGAMLGGALLWACATPRGAARDPGGDPFVPAFVERVVDGDTVVLAGRQRVRLAGVNCPEIDEPLGIEAREFALKMVGRKDVRVRQDRKDRYGRLVTDIRLGDRSLAEALVEAGLAHVFLIPPVDPKEAASLLRAQEQARERRVGIWGTDRYQGDFHITSFHANPIGDDTADLNAEYLRIANLRTDPRSLEGWIISNEHGDRYVFGPVVVPGGHTVTLATGSGEDQTSPDQPIRLFWRQNRPMWSNRGDAATLMDPSGQVVDRVEYDPKHRKVYPR